MNLYDKYTVKKKAGETDPKAVYFVLRLDKDYHARVAARAYARSIRSQDPEFANELDKLIENAPERKKQ